MARPHVSPRQDTEWPVVDDLVLALAIENGATPRQVSVVLGRTRNACLGKWRRLNANVSRERRIY